MATEKHNGEDNVEDLPLSKAVQYLLEECRTVLPGIQALFGFQLITVFNSNFTEKLTTTQQRWHLAAIALLAIAIALIMAPAAYHRQTGPLQVSRALVQLATRMLLASMIPLALSVCIDFYLVTGLIVKGWIVPVLVSVMFVVYMTLWFVLPNLPARHGKKRGRHVSGGE